MIYKVLNIEFGFGGIQDAIHPVVLKDEKNMILVDCGYTGFLPKIEEAVSNNGLNLSELTHVIITHQDHDHMGALYDLKNKYPDVKVIAHGKEAPYISGRKKSLRLVQAERLQKWLPENEKAFGIALQNVISSVKPVDVDIEVEDNQVLELCGGITIVGTPGHTPGHISLYVKEKDVLIAGDAAAVNNGKLVMANPKFTLDVNNAEESLKKLIGHSAKRIICYHGGEYIKD